MKRAAVIALLVTPWSLILAVILVSLRKPRSRHWRRYVRTLRASR